MTEELRQRRLTETHKFEDTGQQCSGGHPLRVCKHCNGAECMVGVECHPPPEPEGQFLTVSITSDQITHPYRQIIAEMLAVLKKMESLDYDANSGYTCPDCSSTPHWPGCKLVTAISNAEAMLG